MGAPPGCVTAVRGAYDTRCCSPAAPRAASQVGWLIDCCSSGYEARCCSVGRHWRLIAALAHAQSSDHSESAHAKHADPAYGARYCLHTSTCLMVSHARCAAGEGDPKQGWPNKASSAAEHLRHVFHRMGLDVSGQHCELLFALGCCVVCLRYTTADRMLSTPTGGLSSATQHHGPWMTACLGAQCMHN